MARRYRKNKDTLDEKSGNRLKAVLDHCWPYRHYRLGVFGNINLETPRQRLIGDSHYGISQVISSFAGDFSVYLCFLIVLTAIFKIVQLQEPLPKPVWGFLGIVDFTSSLWHHAKIPWEETFSMARMGAGGESLRAD